MKIKRIFIKHSDVLLVASTFLFFYIKNNPLNKIEPSWLGGWDQSKLIQSSYAFINYNLDSTEHHYPIFYSLIASPFFLITKFHGFLFIDIFCIIFAYVFFRNVFLEYNFNRISIAFIYLISLTPSTIGNNLITPNTIKISYLLFFNLIYVFYNFLKNKKTLTNYQIFSLGISPCILIFNRPFDLVAILPIYILIFAFNYKIILNFQNFSKLLCSFSVLFIPLSFLFLKIHDFQFNSYLGRVNEIGFNFSDILKYYNIYFNSTIYLDNIHASLLNHNYWTYLFLPSIYVLLIKKDDFLFYISLIIITYIYLYSTYNDMLPSNFIKYGTVRYITWTFPLMFIISIRSLNLILKDWKNFQLLLSFFVILTLEIGIIYLPYSSYSNAFVNKKIFNDQYYLISEINSSEGEKFKIFEINHNKSIADKINMFYGYELTLNSKIEYKNKVLENLNDYKFILLKNKIRIIFSEYKFGDNLKIFIPKDIFKKEKNGLWKYKIGKINLY